MGLGHFLLEIGKCPPNSHLNPAIDALITNFYQIGMSAEDTEKLEFPDSPKEASSKRKICMGYRDLYFACVEKHYPHQELDQFKGPPPKGFVNEVLKNSCPFELDEMLANCTGSWG